VVKADEIVNELRPLLQRFVKERKPGERFGDFANHAILKETAAPMPA
jgi:sulfite reductase beta subunit-like hemoprotein